jgi:tripartite-type tricarboxylate transporter receptor subunit TctC
MYGFPAGSSGDSVARRVAERLGGTPYSKGPGFVENKPGAGGRIAVEALKNAPPNGSVLALAPVSAFSVYPHIYPKLTYRPEDAMAVSIGAVIYHGLAVGPAVPAEVRTLKDFLAWAKAHPDRANFGSPGGRLRVLATSGRQRSPFLPEVPTFAELGFPDVTVEEWFGFYAPARTPAATIANANAAITAALKDKAVIDGLAALGLLARGSTPQEMAADQQAEFERWSSLVRQIGFTGES